MLAIWPDQCLSVSLPSYPHHWSHALLGTQSFLGVLCELYLPFSILIKQKCPWVCYSWLRCSRSSTFLKNGTERMRGWRQTWCWVCGSSARLLHSTSWAWGWLCSPHTFSGGSSLNSPSAGASPPAFVGFSPIKWDYLARKTSSTACRTNRRIPPGGISTSGALCSPSSSPSLGEWMCLVPACLTASISAFITIHRS